MNRLALLCVMTLGYALVLALALVIAWTGRDEPFLVISAGFMVAGSVYVVGDYIREAWVDYRK